MRQQKQIKIDDDPITVHELTVQDILDIWGGADGDASTDSLLGQIQKFLPRATDLSLEKLQKMAPSEIKQVLEAFKEVNSAFFDLAQALGLGDLLGQIREAMLKDLGGIFVASYGRAMSASGSTDSASIKAPSRRSSKAKPPASSK